jgi:peptidyl-prolyl cis-trans isomerase C
VRLLLTVVLSVVAIGSGTAATVNRINAVPAGAAFRVEGTLVTIQQLDDRVRLLGALYGVQAPSDPKHLDQFRRDTAKSVAVTYVLDKAAADEGIVTADKAANDQLTQILQTAYPQGRDDFVKKLGRLGVSEQDALDEVKRQMTYGQLYEKVTKDLPFATDDEVTAYYNGHRAQMATPEKRHLRNIVVGSEADAKKVRAQLDAGADFAKIAMSSLDQSTKGQGGDLGMVVRDELEPNYGAAAFSVPANGLFGPTQTKYGWNVGQALEIVASIPLTLDHVRDDIRIKLTEERKSKIWNDWLDRCITEAHIRYSDYYRPADSDASPTP